VPERVKIIKKYDLSTVKKLIRWKQKNDGEEEKRRIVYIL